MTIRLRSAMPAGDLAGITDTDGLITAIVLLEPCRRTEDLDTGEITTTLRIDRIEQITGATARKVTGMMHAAYEARTGKVPLDLDGAA